MNFYAFERRILLFVTGLSPQIITETLYSLAIAVHPHFIPTEIHLITTAEGARHAALTLLDREQGEFWQLCREYGLDANAMRFDATTMHVIKNDAGLDLNDIRTGKDNEAAADTITSVVRDLTADSQCTVHASIAGGRKTMGFFLGYAMSLFGRPQDRLSHVLVSAPFESHFHFFYPPHKPQVLYTGNNRPVHTSEAVVTLADIPFVRLRDSLDKSLLVGSATYNATVSRAQFNLEPAKLVLDPETGRVRCGDTVVRLPPVEFAFLTWFARRAQRGRPPLRWTEAEADEFLHEYRKVADELSGDYERAVQALRTGMTKEYFEQHLSKLRSALNRAMGRGPAKPYQITVVGRRPQSRYTLGLKPDQIRFGAVDESPGP